MARGHHTVAYALIEGACLLESPRLALVQILQNQSAALGRESPNTLATSLRPEFDNIIDSRFLGI